MTKTNSKTTIQRIQALVAAGLNVTFDRLGVCVCDAKRGFVNVVNAWCAEGHDREITGEQVERALATAEAYVAEHAEHGHLCMCVDCLSRANTPKPEVRR